MNDVMIFTIGSVVFVTYMLFLGRMIWKQHQIQQQNRPNMFVVKDTQEKEEKRQAS